MPLTFAHPAIILPFNLLPRRWISLTGLIAGSVAPDFEYFLRMKVMSVYSHTWSGLFWFDLPVGIMVAFVYHNIAKKSFVSNLPDGLYQRFLIFNGFNWNIFFRHNVVIVVISVITGIASHLFWDSFTHASGYFVQTFYKHNQVQIFNTWIPLYKVVQHVSTFIGAVAIIATMYKMPIQSVVNSKIRWVYWFIVMIIVCLIVTAQISGGLNFNHYWDVLVTSISAGIIAIVIAPLILKLKTQWRTH